MYKSANLIKVIIMKIFIENFKKMLCDGDENINKSEMSSKDE